MDHRPFTIRDALHGINRRKSIVFLFFTATVLLIGVLTLIAPKTYKSDARLFMRLGRENATLDATATMGEQPVFMLPSSRDAEINSIVELIQSKNIYERVVDELGPERILKRNWRPAGEAPAGEAVEGEEASWIGSAFDSLMATLTTIGVVNDLPLREKAVIKLQKNVDIEAFEKSNVLTVSFKSHSPELAQLVVGKIVATYIRQHVDLHRPPKAFEFLREQTERVEQELTQSRTALEEFKNETRILSAEEQRSVLIARMATLESELLAVEAEEAGLSREVEELVKSLSLMSATTVTATTTGAGNEAVDGMRQELYKLEMLRELYAAKFTPEHPQLREVDAQVTNAKSILSLVESGRKQSIEGPNKIYEETSVALEQKRPILEAVRAKRAKLQQQIDQFNAQLDRFTANERVFAKLERDVEVLEVNYRKYFVNLEHARIDAKLQAEELSNIGVPQPATLNLKPYSPNKLINLAAAIVLGLCGGLGLAVLLEYLNPGLQTFEDYEAILSSTVIAAIPDLSARNLSPRLKVTPLDMEKAEVP